MKIILASASPRRQELLNSIGVDYIVQSEPVDETFDQSLPRPLATEQIALKKAMAVKSQEMMVLGADTIVVFDDEVLGKPHDRQTAFTMLRKLAGEIHDVITAVALVYQGEPLVFHDITHVTFKELTDDQINAYIEKYQPFDKAGAYGLQDFSDEDTFIEEISGDPSTVIGLPLQKLKKIFKELEMETIHD